LSEIEGLRSLADVDSPDVLHAAAKRFRRRMLARGAWTILTLVAAVVIALSVYEQARPPLSRLGIPTGVYSAESLQVGGADVVLLQAQYDGDYVGLHFVSVLPGTPHACVKLTPGPYTPVVRAPSDGESACGGGVGEDWLYMPRPLGERIDFTVSDGGQRLGSFVLRVPAPPSNTIDMQEGSDG
jgi:hypothetical protein